MGDLDGSLRLVLEHFPYPAAARHVWQHFFVPGGKGDEQPFELVSQPHLEEGPALVELTVLANFAEVFLARQGHTGWVGVHYHDSARLALLPSLFGALLAGVDFLLVSASGVAAVQPALRRLLAHESAALDVTLTDTDRLTCGFDPHSLGSGHSPALRAPILLAVCETVDEAESVLTGAGFDGGFIVQAPSGAGWLEAAEFARLRSLGRPFWLGNVAATAENFARVSQEGAGGLQVNTPFTFCAESALDPDLKRRVLTLVRQDPNHLFTQLSALPDGQPFRVLRLEETAADPEISAARLRLCDVGWFREVYRRPDGSVGYRCPGEPMHHYLLKGGDATTAARQPCICNGVLAGLGLAQLQDGRELERALVPVGEDVRELRRFLKPGGVEFTAADVVKDLTGGIPATPAPRPDFATPV